MSSCVSRIDSISKNNRIEAMIILKSLIKTKSAKFESSINQIQSKAVSFSFSSIGSPVDIRPERKNVVIDNFVNLTGDKDLNWLSTGLTDIVTNKMSQINSINLQSQDSLKKESQDFCEMIIVNGSYQKDNDGLRIIAKVSDFTTDKVIGTVMVAGKLDNIFSVQDELAIKIAGALNIDLTSNKDKELKEKLTKNLKSLRVFFKRVKIFSYSKI